MKVHKRFYSAIPRPLAASSSSAQSSTPVVRVRSNSVGSSRSLYTAPQSPLPFAFFDTPPPQPPPSSRPGPSSYVIPSRIAAEAKLEVENFNSGQSNAPQTHSQHSGPLPYSLVFSSGSSQSSANSNPASLYPLFYPYTSFGSSPLNASLDCSSDTAHPSKRQRTRYHLDVGAYGIPKHSRDPRAAGRGGHMHKPFTSSGSLHDGSQAVQVGEDAYFIRENAMGIADGVGGWARTRGSARKEGPSPSALFAHRLMHYCCEEVISGKEQHVSHEASFDELDYGALNNELDDTLEDLADGLDVLMVLERAYDKTIRAHVVPPTSRSPSQDAVSNPESSHPSSPASSPLHASSSPPSGPRSANSPIPESLPPPNAEAAPKPLKEGSSTALLAILDHSSIPSPKPPIPVPLLSPQLRRTVETAHTPTTDRGDAVLHVAHLGDCMAMLIRADEIVWRTEEMWWDFNTPVQLGPASSTRPRDAHISTVPVQADDILVLASDGLTDNLWDEDILDEVLRFRQSFMASDAESDGTSLLRRSTLAGMLSEALCSRARCVSEKKGTRRGQRAEIAAEEEDEIPFARRAREQGRYFDGGKPDDICVLVAVVSPSEPTPP